MMRRSVGVRGLRVWLAVLVFGVVVGGGYGEEMPAAPSGAFSIVALPDTQAYSAREPAVYYAETQWIVDNVERQRIVFVTHLGDIVDKNVPAQWEVAVRAMRKLDGKVPHGMGVGNHDMKCGEEDASLFSSMFPAKRFEKEPWYGGQLNDNVNSFQTFEAEGLKFVILHLVCSAPDEVLAWADEVLKRHADRRAIITTHMFLGPREQPTTKEGWYTDPKGVMRWSKCHGKKGNSPAKLWEKCFSKHGNVFLILCGDQSRSQTMHVELKGQRGNVVHACLSDYRGGFLRMYRFLPKASEIRVMTYSPSARAFCRGTPVVKDEGKHQFTLRYEMAGE